MAKLEHPYFRKSLCLNHYLHRFEIKKEFESGVLEVCEICKMKKFFKIVNGRINNYDYMSYHFRLALPPNHPYSKHEYPREEGIKSPYYA